MQFPKTRAYIDGLIESKGLPYIDVCAWQDHTPIFRHSYSAEGVVTGKEPLFLYSATKPITVACAMRLVEEGKLGLDEPLYKYVPAYAHARVKTSDGGTKPLEEPILIRHLFTMSAGLDYNLGMPAILDLKKQNPLAGTVDFVNAFVSEPLQFPAGERFLYSLCHDVLGAVVEVVSGKRFADYARDTVFAPLGMPNTGFHLEDTREIARQYMATQTGEIQEMDRINPFVFTRNYDSGGAGAVGCVDDYIRFADALACGGVGENGYRLLQEETVQKIREVQVQGVSFQNSFTCVQGDEYGYGLGVRVRKKPTAWGLDAGEFGWDGAAGTYLLIDPVKHISVVVGMHLRNWPVLFRGEHLRITERLYTDFFGKN